MRRLIVFMLTLAVFIARLCLPGSGVANASRYKPSDGENETIQGAEKPAAARVAGRTFPSVFQAWNSADNLKTEASLQTMARHDLVFHAPAFFGLRWNNAREGLATDFAPESLADARRMRADLLRRNPNLILLAEIRYHDAHHTYLPEMHAWWKRDVQGKREIGWAEGGYYKLDFANLTFQAQVAQQAQAACRSGVFDGVMLDWWEDTDAHLALIKQIRAALGPQALILVNANDHPIPKTAAYVNGLFMECYRSKTPDDWQRLASTLQWAEKSLRAPHINCLEIWYHQSRRDLNLMRAVTCLSLNLSDGYCLFSDPNDLPTPDHLHDWYDFWAKSLGKAAGKGSRRADGSFRREFSQGTAVYNPMGNAPCDITFSVPRRSLATGKIAVTHHLPPADGDIYLMVNDKAASLP